MGCNNNDNIVPGCGCSDPCDNPTACGCKIELNSECVTNTVQLPCANIPKGLTLDETLKELDDYLCELHNLIQAVSTSITLANVGDRVRVFKGISATGIREFRTLESSDVNTLTITEDGDRIIFEAAETTANPLNVQQNNCGEGIVDSYDNDTLTFKGLTSNTLNISTKGGCVVIDSNQAQTNKLSKSPSQVSSITNTTIETSILGSYNGTNVFTPSDMNNSVYKGVVRGKLSRTATVASTRSHIFRIRFASVIIGAVSIPESNGTQSFEAEFEMSFVPGLTGGAHLTGNVTVTSDSNGDMKRYPIYPSYFSLNTTVNQALTITFTPSGTNTTLQTFRILIDKVR